MSRRLGDPDATEVWGVQHSQGTRWCDGGEESARADMEWILEGDKRRRSDARGHVRLVRRSLGPLEIVENPYEVNP